LEIRLELEEMLETPEALGDLSLALENMGQVSEAQDEWDTAQVAYQQSLQIRRMLEKMLGTPQAQQDVSTSEEHLRRLSQKRADLGEL
jgi:hypothetical protein